MMRPGFSFTMSLRTRFSLTSASRSASSSRHTNAASATRLAIISRSSTSRASAVVSPVIARSAESVPIICPRCTSGTHTKESASFERRDFVRLRKRLSFLTSHTTSAFPVFATRPVIPSPSL